MYRQWARMSSDELNYCLLHHVASADDIIRANDTTKFNIAPFIRSCGACPDGAASLVCNFSNYMPTFQNDMSPVPVVHGFIGTVKETSVK